MFYALNVVEGLQESNTFREAEKSKDSQRWLAAVNHEINSLMKNHTWELVRLPNKKAWLDASGPSRKRKVFKEFKNEDLR